MVEAGVSFRFAYPADTGSEHHAAAGLFVVTITAVLRAADQTHIAARGNQARLLIFRSGQRDRTLHRHIVNNGVAAHAVAHHTAKEGVVGIAGHS